MCAVTATALWGSAFPAVKVGFGYFDQLDLQTRVAFAGIRFFLAGLMLLAFIPKWRQKFASAPKKLLFGAAFLQVGLQYLFFYWGLSLISASLTAIIVGTGSFWWVLAAPLVDKREKVTIGQLLMLLLGFGGVVVCMYEPGKTLKLGGALLVMLATVSGTGALLMVRPLSQHVPVTFITGFSLFAGGLVFILLTPGRSLEIVLNSPWQLQILTLYLAFLSAIAFSLWYWLITLYDVTRLSAYRFLIPIFGVSESVLFLTSETLSQQLVAGGALVVLSIVILEWINRRKKRILE
ncbi:MAG: drug/metabolite transporter (DMT)-like permease [Rhodothermales bacterium]